MIKSTSARCEPNPSIICVCVYVCVCVVSCRVVPDLSVSEEVRVALQAGGGTPVSLEPTLGTARAGRRVLWSGSE